MAGGKKSLHENPAALPSPCHTVRVHLVGKEGGGGGEQGPFLTKPPRSPCPPALPLWHFPLILSLAREGKHELRQTRPETGFLPTNVQRLPRSAWSCSLSWAAHAHCPCSSLVPAQLVHLQRLRTRCLSFPLHDKAGVQHPFPPKLQAPCKELLLVLVNSVDSHICPFTDFSPVQTATSCAFICALRH